MKQQFQYPCNAPPPPLFRLLLAETLPRDETKARQGLILSDGLQAINFTYFDNDGIVHKSWDSDSEEFNGLAAIWGEIVKKKRLSFFQK